MGQSSFRPAGVGGAYTARLETYTYLSAHPARARALSRTTRGAPAQVSTTTSHRPSASGARSAGRSRSPVTARASGWAHPARPRVKVVTCQPRSTAAVTTHRPTNVVPPSTSNRMPFITVS